MPIRMIDNPYVTAHNVNTTSEPSSTPYPEQGTGENVQFGEYPVMEKPIAQQPEAVGDWGFDENGNWFNNTFAETRDEQFLQPEDVMGAESNAQAAPEYSGLQPDAQRQVAKEALKRGLYREMKGNVRITDPVAFQEIIQNALQGTLTNEDPTSVEFGQPPQYENPTLK